MRYKDKMRWLMIAGSLLFVVLFLNKDQAADKLFRRVAGVKQVSREKIASELQKKNQIQELPGLQFNDSSVFYDQTTETIYVPQNIEEELFTGSLSGSSGNKLYFLQDEYFDKKDAAIRENHKFTLYVVSKSSWFQCSVIFTGMPMLQIEEDNTKDRYQDKNDRTVVSGQMQLTDPYRSAAKNRTAACSYHIRGGSSEYYEKPNYKLELTEEKLSLLGMDESSDWVLNSLYDDAGLLHNKVSFDVWQIIAEHNQVKGDEGVNGEYVELFLDQEYMGVYLLTKRPDEKTLKLDQGDFYYKCRSDRIPQEHNYTNENMDEMRPIFVLKYPKEDTAENWEPLKEWVNAFAKLQADSYEEAESLLNMENHLDYSLFVMLIDGVDNMRKNMLLIADRRADGSYQYVKVPWDMNATWGNWWVEDEASSFTIYEPKGIEDVGAWCTDMTSLYYYGESRAALQMMSRWKALRDDEVITKEKLYDIVDRQLTYLRESGAYDRNYERWTNGREYWQDPYIYEYIDGRLDFLDEYYTTLYEETRTPYIYDGVDYSGEFEFRFYWNRYGYNLPEEYAYNRDLLLEHYVLFGKPHGLHGKMSREYPDDWEYLYNNKWEKE